MKRLFGWRRKISETDLLEFEKRLQAVYGPVTPRSEFVNNLRHQLISDFNPEAPERKLNAFQIWLIAGASIFSGIMLVFMSIRAVVALLIAISGWRQNMRKLQQERLTSAESAA